MRVIIQKYYGATYCTLVHDVHEIKNLLHLEGLRWPCLWAPEHRPTARQHTKQRTVLHCLCIFRPVSTALPTNFRLPPPTGTNVPPPRLPPARQAPATSSVAAAAKRPMSNSSNDWLKLTEDFLKKAVSGVQMWGQTVMNLKFFNTTVQCRF